MIHQVCFTFSERLMSLIFAKTMRSKNIVRSGVRTNKTPIHLKKLNCFFICFSYLFGLGNGNKKEQALFWQKLKTSVVVKSKTNLVNHCSSLEEKTTSNENKNSSEPGINVTFLTECKNKSLDSE